MNIKEIFLYAYAAWNAAVFTIYGLDKLFAVSKKQRISELCLALSAVFMGALGAALGMIVFNHKTSKKKFRFLVPAALLLNIGIIALLISKGILM